MGFHASAKAVAQVVGVRTMADALRVRGPRRDALGSLRLSAFGGRAKELKATARGDRVARGSDLGRDEAAYLLKTAKLNGRSSLISRQLVVLQRMPELDQEPSDTEVTSMTSAFSKS